MTKDWLVKDDSGKLVKDEKVWDEKLWEFLDRLAYNTNTIGMDRQFNSTLRGLITVSGGDYGYMVNQVTEHDKLVKDFKKQKKETREPDYYITPYNDQTENDGIGNTYIEADLSAQHIWCYVDGQLVVEGDFVGFCERVCSLLPEHKHLPTPRELARMAVQSFAKPVSMWVSADAPVQGSRFYDYLRIAKQTGEILSRKPEEQQN